LKFVGTLRPARQGDAAVTTARQGYRAGGAGCGVIQIEDLVIEGDFCRVSSGSQIRESRRLESRTGHENWLRGGNEQAQAFRIEEEKGLVAHDVATQGSSPLVSVIERARSASVVQKPIIRVENAAIPEIFKVAVVSIAAGLGDVIDIHASETAVLSGVAVIHDGGGLDVVGAQHQVGGP
jgi:hypothetical protein